MSFKMTRNKQNNTEKKKPKEYPGVINKKSRIFRPITITNNRRIYSTPEEFLSKVNEYFLRCAIEDRVPTIARLASYMDFASVAGFYKYKEYGDEYDEIISKCLLAVEANLQEHLIGYRIRSNTIGIIFTLKNLYGWVDQTYNRNDNSLEVVPRAELESQLEHQLARIAGTSREAEMVSEIDDKTDQSTEV